MLDGPVSKIHSSGYFVGREPQTRTPLVVAQWTDQRTSRVAGELVKDLVMRLGDVSDREIIVAPSSIGLGPALESARGTRIGIGAQNLSSQPKADSPWNAASQALSDVGVKAVVLGHSSARQVLGETDATVALKVRTVLDHGLSPILCVGERDQKCLTKWWLYKQVSLAIAAVRPEEVHRLTVAHEPAWEPHQPVVGALRDRTRGSGLHSRMCHGNNGGPSGGVSADLVRLGGRTSQRGRNNVSA